MRTFPLLFALTALAVSACGPVTPVPAFPTITTNMPAPTALTTNVPAPTALPTSLPASPVPTASVPTLPDIVPAPAWHSSDLEPITPQNVERLEQIGRWGGGEFYGLAVSPDQKKIAVYTATQLFLLDSYSLEKIRDIPYSPDGGLIDPNAASQNVAFSPDGKYLAIAKRNSIELWDIVANQMADRVNVEAASYIEFSPDGEFVAVNGRFINTDKSCAGPRLNLAIYSRKDRILLGREICHPWLWNAWDKIGSFSPDGSLLTILVNSSRLANSSQDTLSTQIVRIPSLDIVDTHEGQIEFVALANGQYTWKSRDEQPQEARLPCGRDSSIYRMLANDGKKAVINPKGDFGDPSYNTLELLDLSDCRVLKKVSFESAGTLLFSPDGRVLASWRYGHIEFFSMPEGTPLSSVSPEPTESGFNLLCFNADGSLMVTGLSSMHPDGGPDPAEYELSVWDVRTGNRLKTLVPATAYLYDLSCTPDKNIIAAVDLDGLHFWDVQKGLLLRSSERANVLFAQNENRMAAVFNDRIEISDFRTGKITQTITVHDPYLEAVFNRDASKLAIVSDKKLEVFDIGSGKLVYQDESVGYSYFPIVFGDLFVLGPKLRDFEHTQPVRTLSDSGTFTFTPDGQMLLSQIRNHIRFWDLNTGLLLREVVLGFMKPDLYRISDIALSPDGRLIAITGQDGWIHILGVKKP